MLFFSYELVKTITIDTMSVYPTHDHGCIHIVMQLKISLFM